MRSQSLPCPTGPAGASADLGSQVLELIGPLLSTGEVTLQVVANHLHRHPRTLQRQLRERGLMYRDLLELARRDQIRTLLDRDDLTLGQVSRMVGYAEQSGLTRSCRRLLGAAPTQVRRSILAEQVTLPGV